MFLQVEIPTESLPTDFTGKRLLIIVGVHVESEIVDLMEGLITNVTFIGFIPTVCQLVILIVALLMESLAAVLTDEGFVAVVDPNVCIEGRAPIKGFPTSLTFMRLLGCVDDFMTAEG